MTDAYRSTEDATQLGDRTFVAKQTFSSLLGHFAALFVLGMLAASFVVLAITHESIVVQIMSALVAIAALLPTVLLARMLPRSMPHTIEEHENGLVEVRGGRRRVFATDDLVSVSVSKTVVKRGAHVVQTSQEYELRRKDGAVLHLIATLDQVERMGDRIEKSVMERVGPALLASYEEGKRVDFGPYAITRDGLLFKGKTLPWEDARVIASDGSIVVRVPMRLSPWAKVSYGAVPNARVFLALCDRASKLRA